MYDGMKLGSYKRIFAFKQLYACNPYLKNVVNVYVLYIML